MRTFVVACLLCSIAACFAVDKQKEGPTSPCTDGKRDGDETDLDCGGSCKTCPAGGACGSAHDCATGACGLNGLCVPATCVDGQMDPGESGVDCGGSCGGCLAASCAQNGDCAQGDCDHATCAVPSCTDGVRDGSETGTDCGGAGCPACAAGEGCNAAADCSTQICHGGTCAMPDPTCTDGKKDGTESDLDCGGGCPSCPTGKVCAAGTDCLSGFCMFGICTVPTCSDGYQNEGEADVDCGGGHCNGCTDGKKCGAPADCASSRCEDDVCTSCADHVQNGGETGVDCGGPCPACDDGTACGGSQECSSDHCEGGHCCTPNKCGFCGPTPVETCNGVDDNCDGRIDEPEALTPPPCPDQLGVCAGAVASCHGAAGWVCDAAAYASHSPSYQTSETTCDGLDNDCDGSTDETATCPARLCQTGTCSGGGCTYSNVPNGQACGSGLYCIQGECEAPSYYCACTNGYSNCTFYDHGTPSPSLWYMCGCGLSPILEIQSTSNFYDYNCNDGCLNEDSGLHLCF